MFNNGSRRQPGRDRRAGLSGRCASSASRRSPSHSDADRFTPPDADGRRSGAARPGAGRRQLSRTSTPSSPPAGQPAPRRSIPATASSPRMSNSPSVWRRRTSSSSGRGRSIIRAFGLKHTAREIAARAACRFLPGSGSARRSRRGGGRGRAHRLSGDAEEHGRRRRHRHAALPRRGRSCASASPPCSALAAGEFRRCAASISSASSPSPATSRCRSSVTARAAWWRSASATARCSAATRRSSRKRPRPACLTRCARALHAAAAIALGRRRRLRIRRHGRIHL